MATWRKVIVSGSDAELNTLDIGGGSGGSGTTLSTAGAITADAAVTAGTSFIIGSADINETDLEKIDGITNGTAAANKAVVLDASGDITSGINDTNAMKIHLIESAPHLRLFIMGFVLLLTMRFRPKGLLPEKKRYA